MHDHTNHVVASDTQMKAWAVSNKADGAMALIGAELSSGHCVAKVIALLPVVCRSLRMTQGALGAMHPAARGLGPSPAPCSCGAHCGAGKGARRGERGRGPGKFVEGSEVAPQPIWPRRRSPALLQTKGRGGSGHRASPPAPVYCLPPPCRFWPVCLPRPRGEQARARADPLWARPLRRGARELGGPGWPAVPAGRVRQTGGDVSRAVWPSQYLRSEGRLATKCGASILVGSLAIFCCVAN